MLPAGARPPLPRVSARIEKLLVLSPHYDIVDDLANPRIMVVYAGFISSAVGSLL